MILRGILISTLLVCASCGQHPVVRPIGKPEPSNPFAQSVTADTSMRQVINKKWTCTHKTTAAALPYRKITILNDGTSQSLQVSRHYLAGETPTLDYLTVDGLNCFFSSAESRIVKCFSKADTQLKIETSLTAVHDDELQFDLLSLKIQGAEKSFKIYFGGSDNRFATLS